MKKYAINDKREGCLNLINLTDEQANFLKFLMDEGYLNEYIEFIPADDADFQTIN